MKIPDNSSPFLQEALARALQNLAVEAVMFLFDCIVRMGHQGAGRSMERHVRVRADNALEAMRRAKILPGVKKGFLRTNGASVLSVSLVR